VKKSSSEKPIYNKAPCRRRLIGKCLRFELSSLIRKHNLKKDMLCREILGEIFFFMICMISLYPHKNHVLKLFVLNCTSHQSKTQNRAQQNETAVTVYGVKLTHWIWWSPNEWPSLCWGIPQCTPVIFLQKLPAHPISLRSEHCIFVCIYMYLSVLILIYFRGPGAIPGATRFSEK
jgi:hypothetical protein